VTCPDQSTQPTADTCPAPGKSGQHADSGRHLGWLFRFLNGDQDDGDTDGLGLDLGDGDINTPITSGSDLPGSDTD
jgi:hypothetical protein